MTDFLKYLKINHFILDIGVKTVLLIILSVIPDVYLYTYFLGATQ